MVKPDTKFQDPSRSPVGYFLLCDPPIPDISHSALMFTKYLLLQKWLPQYGRFFNIGYFLNIIISVSPSAVPIYVDIETLGEHLSPNAHDLLEHSILLSHNQTIHYTSLYPFASACQFHQLIFEAYISVSMLYDNHTCMLHAIASYTYSSPNSTIRLSLTHITTFQNGGFPSPTKTRN